MKRSIKYLLIFCVVCWIIITGIFKFSFEDFGVSPNSNVKLNVESAGSNAEMIFTYAENQIDTYPSTMAAYRFSELVKEKSDGRIEIVVKSAAQLGSEQSVIEQLSFGGIDFARVSVAAIEDYVPEIMTFELPYIFEDSTHKWRVLDGEIGDGIKKLIGNSTANIKALSWYDSGVRNFYGRYPIESIEDVRGKKVRIQDSDVMEAFIRKLGGIPVKVEFAKVYSDLQLGNIDMAENSWPCFESQKHYKVSQFLTVDEHAMVPDIQLVSNNVWDKLSEEDRAIIKECAEESAMYERQIWEQRENSSVDRMVREGIVVIELSAYEKRRFEAVAQSIYNEVCPEYIDIIEDIRELR